MSKLNKLAALALVLNLLGYIPKIGHLFSLAGFILGIFVYRELESLGLISNAWKKFMAITLLSLIAVVLAVIGYLSHNITISIIFSILAYATGLLTAWITYLLSREVMATAINTQEKSFKIAAVLLKISAFTMPVLIGFLIQGLAQLVFLIAAIIYKPNQAIED